MSGALARRNCRRATGVDWFPKVFHRLSMPSDPIPSEAARADLIRAIATSRDRPAFIALFGFYAPRIKAQAMRYGLDSGAAEDVAQDAMLSVWQRAAQFDPARGSASAWVFTIATNARIDRSRREKRLVAGPASEADDMLTAVEFPDHTPDTARLADLVATLPQDQRQIVQLSFYSELSHGEIASRLGIPLGTVKSRVRLAIARLRQRLGDEP